MSASVHQFDLVADLPEIPRVLALIENMAEEHGWPMHVVHHISLALDELLTNIISYGWEDAQGHKISLRIDRWDDRLTIEIKDDGRAFDPLAQPDPDVDLEVDERAIGGLGIHLVKSLMNGVSYRYEDGFNVLTLQKSLAE